MSAFVAEPVPTSLDAELAEYLNRMLTAVQLGIETAGAVAIVSETPDAPNGDTPLVAGAFLNVNQPRGLDGTDYSRNGLWGCMYNHQGNLEWKRYLPQSN